MIRWEVALGVLTLAVFLIFIAAWTVRAVVTESHCLRAGYPVSHLTFAFEAYCTREENEFEITVPLDVARGRQD